MNKWRAGHNNATTTMMISTADGSNSGFLIDYQFLPFLVSPSAISTLALASTATTTIAATNLFIPSLFGASPAGPLMISPSAAAAAATAIAGVSVSPQHRKLFIGGLNHETTDEQLRDYYSKWGQVVDCIVIRDPLSRLSRGFGFVTFITAEMADAAMADRPHTISGKVVDPKRAIPREQMLQAINYPPAFLDVESPSECKLILSGIHWDFHTVDSIRQHFEIFGEVEQVEIVGHPRGHGFVVFEESTAALRCLEYNKTHIVNGKKIEVRECESEAHYLPFSSPSPSSIPQSSSRNNTHHSHPSHNNYNRRHHLYNGRSVGSHHHHHGSFSLGSQSHSPVESMQSSEPDSPTNS